MYDRRGFYSYKSIKIQVIFGKLLWYKNNFLTLFTNSSKNPLNLINDLKVRNEHFYNYNFFISDSTEIRSFCLIRLACLMTVQFCKKLYLLVFVRVHVHARVYPSFLLFRKLIQEKKTLTCHNKLPNMSMRLRHWLGTN